MKVLAIALALFSFNTFAGEDSFPMKLSEMASFPRERLDKLSYLTKAQKSCLTFAIKRAGAHLSNNAKKSDNRIVLMTSDSHGKVVVGLKDAGPSDYSPQSIEALCTNRATMDKWTKQASSMAETIATYDAKGNPIKRESTATGVK